jgi:transcriptional regulator with XRE-family HTH domain
MITNERQLQMARRDLERFEAAVAGDVIEVGVDPIILNAQKQALENQANELRRDIDDYLRLRTGEIRTFRIETLADLPRALISCRIASGMTQKELADRLGLKEQQIQRYETQNYSGASFSRIADVADAVGLEMPRELKLANAGSIEAILKRVALAGLDPQFVRRRIAPMGDPRSAADRLGFVFDWNPDDIFSTVPLELPAVGGSTARFKMPRRRNERGVAAYTAYAHRLAQICANAMPGGPPEEIPTSARPMIEIIRRRGSVDFEATLETAWDLGIIVLPLGDGGQFHGAHWRINGTNVVILKQGEKSSAKWLIDLLHEIFHAARFPDQLNHAVIEEAETSDHRREDEEERRATWYASLVATDGRAEEIFAALINETSGNIRFLKNAVARKATATGLDAGVIANYVAYRLELQHVDWWGAAANLQDRSIDPLAVARDTFFRRFNFSALNEDELELLQLALHDEVHDG